MEEYSKYAILASTINIEDITPNKENQITLQRLKDNDESLDSVHIMDERYDYHDFDNQYLYFSGEDMGWLGYYIGQNTELEELHFVATIHVGSFYKEMSCNTSIEMIRFYQIVLEGKVFRMMDSFLKSNSNLHKISIEECVLDADATHQLSLAIGNCNQSLECFSLQQNEIIGDGKYS